MNSQRKMLYISVFINFLTGIVLGTVLFYGQMRAQPSSEGLYTYDSTVTFSDFFRVSWMNLIWLFSVLVSRQLISGRFIYPVVAIRGCVCAFSVLYILSFLGVREAAASVIPQCFSSLPLLSAFSVETAARCRESFKKGDGVCPIKRHEVAAILAFSVLAGGAEVLIFRFLCSYLF